MANLSKLTVQHNFRNGEGILEELGLKSLPPSILGILTSSIKSEMMDSSHLHEVKM